MHKLYTSVHMDVSRVKTSTEYIDFTNVILPHVFNLFTISSFISIGRLPCHIEERAPMRI